MDRDDEYRAKAAEAQKWADRASNPEDKAKWPGVVEGWLGLIRHPKNTVSQNFDQLVEKRGTDQNNSEGSH